VSEAFNRLAHQQQRLLLLLVGMAQVGDLSELFVQFRHLLSDDLFEVPGGLLRGLGQRRSAPSIGFARAFRDP